MAYLFVCYPGCSTCQKAERWLEERGIKFEKRNIKAQNPSRQELAAWVAQSGLDSRRFFSTSGMRYRELALKDKLASMSLPDRLELLSADGMLVRRPLLVGEDTVLVGFSPKEWDAALA